MKSTDKKYLIKVTVSKILLILSVLMVYLFCNFWGVLVFIIDKKPKQQVEANIQDPFIAEREKEFHLSTVIPKYDKVITAIEQYYEDHGSYPQDLNILVPEYLAEVPGIYIRNGERLTYNTEPWMENTPAFVFYIYGHYPFPAFMHGWYLMYCPSTYLGCAAGGDRHSWTYTINDRWIWISSSAL